MNVVVQLSTGKGSGMESNRVKFAVWIVHGKNGRESIIRSVSFHDQWLVGNPVREDWSRSERFLEKFESGVAFRREVPCSTFPCELGKRNCDFQVVMNESPVEVGEAKEGLYVFNLPRFQPLLDNLNFFVGHCQAEVRQDISEEFNGISVPFAFIRFGVETVFPQASEQFVDVFLVLFEIVGIDKDIIEIDKDIIEIDHDAFV